MIVALRWLFGNILIAMLAVTISASLDRSLTIAASELWPDLWFRATLADAYFGFFTIWIWMAYKETNLGTRLVWFCLVMTLGNIAIAAYLLRLLFQAAPNDPIERIVLRPSRP